MKPREISVTVERDGTIKLPKSFTERFNPGQSIRLIAVAEGENEEQLWLRTSAKHFFSDDDPADQLYADYARQVAK